MAESLNLASAVQNSSGRSIQESLQQRIAQQRDGGSEQIAGGATERVVTARAAEANGQSPRVDAPQNAIGSNTVSLSEEALSRLASEQARSVTQAISGQTTAGLTPTAADQNPAGDAPQTPPRGIPSQSLQGQIDALLGDRSVSGAASTAPRELGSDPAQSGRSASVAGQTTQSSAPSAVVTRQTEEVRAADQSNPSSVGGGVEISGGNRITPQQ